MPQNPPENSDLERRVLAHERILQSLIAYMSQAEPRFLDHLRKHFLDPMERSRREHDHTETDGYAEDFIQAVVTLSSTFKKEDNRVKRGVSASHAKQSSSIGAPTCQISEALDRVRVFDRNGIWAVTVDGKFHGDYLQREYADAGAALARLSLAGE